MTFRETGRPSSDDQELRGTVQPFKDARSRVYWRARITLPDGERVWLKPRFDKKERAQEYADDKAREAERREITLDKMAPAKPKAAGETCDAWHERYLANCVARGLSTTGDKRYRWSKWISPKIGGKPPAEVTREHVEEIRNELDDAIRSGRIKWKTAANAWGELSASLAEMCASKRKDLQVLAVDPSVGVRAPETGGATSKVYPYPSEFLAVAGCEDVPLEWREIHTIAAYTFTRPGELWVLDWESDVDLADEQISITRAWDFKNKKIKATKTEETRSIPIEPNLLPLLRRMHKRAGGKGLVVPTLSQTHPDHLAELTREHFELAQCKRARLYKRSASERHVVFRSWRDAGCTWAIVRGDGIERVQRRAGHKLIATTQRYIIEAENRGATFGIPFPPLPANLLDPSSKRSSKGSTGKLHPSAIVTDFSCERRDLKPQQSAESSDKSSGFVNLEGLGVPAGQIPTDAKSPNSGRIDAHLDAHADALEGALADALSKATAAGEWAIVGQLARELEARRSSKAGAVDLDAERRARARR